MNSITQNMKYRLSLIKYSQKYGVTKTAIKFKTVIVNKNSPKRGKIFPHFKKDKKNSI